MNELAEMRRDPIAKGASDFEGIKTELMWRAQNAPDTIPKQFKDWKNNNAVKMGDLVVAVRAGMELGFNLTQAMRTIMVVNGMPTVWGDGLPALVFAANERQKREYLTHKIPISEWRFHEISDGMDVDEKGDIAGAWVRCKRMDGTLIERRFTMKQAQHAGLTEVKTYKNGNKAAPGPWQLYPDRMCLNRARAFAVRDAFADLLSGVGVAEEQYDTITHEAQAERHQQAADRSSPQVDVQMPGQETTAPTPAQPSLGGAVEGASVPPMPNTEAPTIDHDEIPSELPTVQDGDATGEMMPSEDPVAASGGGETEPGSSPPSTSDVPAWLPQYSRITELVAKAGSTEDLGNLWKVNAGHIKAMPDEQKAILTAAKDAKKAELAEGGTDG